MKKLILLLLLAVACNSPKKEKVLPFPSLNSSETEWVVYEGKIVTDKGLEVDAELSLMQATVGIDSYFKLDKSLTLAGEYYSLNTKGEYHVSYGLDNHEQGITLKDVPLKQDRKLAANKALKAEGLDKLFMKMEKTQDLLFMPELYFKTEGNERLIQTDKGFNTKGSKYVLYRRSDLFTVEGYVTCEDSLTEFFERNTREKWRVSNLGAIDSIKIKYIELATEQYEGIYLKALAYSIADSTSEIKKSLVIKRLLRMEKSNRENPVK